LDTILDKGFGKHLRIFIQKSVTHRSKHHHSILVNLSGYSW